jgi:hypothetical protein
LGWIGYDVFQLCYIATHSYGRIAKWPIIWSVVVIAVGFGLFWSESKMERKPEADSEYSRYWYSFELFVPVIDVGMQANGIPNQNPELCLLRLL